MVKTIYSSISKDFVSEKKVFDSKEIYKILGRTIPITYDSNGFLEIEEELTVTEKSQIKIYMDSLN